jgi:hypothetical protein
MRRRLRSVWRAEETQLCGVKRSWEIIADNLSKTGWSWGCVSAINSNRRKIWIVDAHREGAESALFSCECEVDRVY